MDVENQIQRRAVSGFAVAALSTACLFSLLCLAFGFQGRTLAPFPSPMEPKWETAWAAGFVASLIVLLGLWQTKSTGQRIVGSLALACSMAGCWLALTSFFQVNHTFYWPIVGGLGMIMIVGASVCGLRILPIGVSFFLLIWFYGIVVPPSTKLPMVREADGVRCVLKSPQELDFHALSGQDISQVIDEPRIEATASVGWLIQATTHPRRRFSLAIAAEHGKDRSFVAMSPEVQRPYWSRSMNLRVAVQRWPKAAACELKIPIRPPPNEGIRVSHGGFDVTTGPVESADTKGRTLIFFLSYARTQVQLGPIVQTREAEARRSELNGSEYGIVDDKGRRLEPLVMGSATKAFDDGYPREVGQLLQVNSIDPRAKWIKIQVYNPDDLAQNRTVFEFDRVP